MDAMQNASISKKSSQKKVEGVESNKTNLVMITYSNSVGFSLSRF